MSKNIAAAIEELVNPIVEANNLELVDVVYVKEGGRWFLRLFIDKEDGRIGLDDCQLISRAIEPVLDEHDLIPNSYSLEVSSPGLERPLKKLSDFDRFKGKRASINTFAPINGQKRFKGVLNGILDTGVRLSIADQEVIIPFEQVAKAKLVAEFNGSGG